MANVRPFLCVRPNRGAAERVAALPYDVYEREEASRAVAGNPLSFLNIDRAETQFPDEVDPYDERVYQKAKELLEDKIREGVYVCDAAESYFIYQLTMDGKSQTGIVSCCSLDDYLDGVIKKHEKTREDKELDRIRHLDVTNAHTGPIFLAYRDEPEIKKITDLITETKPLYDFVSDDGVGHRVWRVENLCAVSMIQAAFAKVPALYIADGHHRAASAVKVGLKRRDENPGYTGQEPFNYFLSVLFPASQLRILPYHRVVRDLNGLTVEELLERIGESFEVSCLGDVPYAPERKGMFGMYLDGRWYRLCAKNSHMQGELGHAGDIVRDLDVSVLQDYLLGPVLGIGDIRVDERIGFVGGIRGLKELERRVGEDMAVAFSLYPTSIEELMAVADAGLLMPPKSTWFEPKLRSGLFIHRFG